MDGGIPGRRRRRLGQKLRRALRAAALARDQAEGMQRPGMARILAEDLAIKRRRLLGAPGNVVGARRREPGVDIVGTSGGSVRHGFSNRCRRG